MPNTEIPSPAPGSSAWWTGQPPTAPLHALPQVRLDASREEVLAYFDNGWTLTETLFSSLRTVGAFMRPPYHNLRHAMIFYYAHPAALYINKLRVAGLRNGPLHEHFEQLFETGVDEMSWDDISKNEMEWPAIDEVHAYRKQVYSIVRELILTHPDIGGKITQAHPLWALFLAFEHERIHLETSSVLIRELPLELVARPKWWPSNAPAKGKAAQGWRKIPAGRAVLGKTDLSTFGWDNEYGQRSVDVPEFEVSSTLISNGEFLEFVKANGYTERRFWSDEGWHWRNGVNARWPVFWISRGPTGLNEFDLRTIFEAIPLPQDWPAVVNFHEAKAFAAWRKGCRLLTEAEHHRIRGRGEAPNLALRFGTESPVSEEIFGNVWHWCEDHFNPLPGFKVHRTYEDFSTPCFDGKHQMILGGSFMSVGDEASTSARFHFRAHFFQHAGFRLVKPSVADDTAVRLNLRAQESSYESENLLGAYCLLHYGSASETIEKAPEGSLEFPRRCADLLARFTRGRAIDVGCAVGGATFRLAETFDSVVGIDLSGQFIAAAKTLQDKGALEYRRRDEGELSTSLVALVPNELARRRVLFRQGDACSLPAELMGFDGVLAANLLCRLPTPRAFLCRLAGSRGLVKRGGFVVLVTPFSWLERFTPRDSWLGGFDGKKSEEGLREAMGPEFELVHREDMPLLIREHARKFEYIVPLATVWRKI